MDCKSPRRLQLTLLIVAILLLQSLLSASSAFASPAASSVQTLRQEQLAHGVHYTETRVLDADIKQRVNTLQVDLGDPYVQLVTSKALDAVIAKDTLTNQIRREEFANRNVVAGINADMFNVSTGVNMGLQVKNGSLLINHSSPKNVGLFPVFAVDAQKQPFIDTLSMEGSLTSNGQTLPLESLNRNESMADKLTLFNQRVNQQKTIIFPATNGAMALITGIPHADELKAGQTYTGNIQEIYTTTNTMTIPDNAVVVAGFGTKAEWLKANLQKNTSFSFSFNLYRGAQHELKNDVVEATSSYNWLVNGGHALTEAELLASYDSGLVKTRNARTAIGLTVDGKVIAVTVDKGSARFADSDGVSLTEMAQIMVQKGAQFAIGLDGGGSTEMAIQQLGTTAISVANHPSDGSERAVTNALLFVSNAPKTNAVGTVKVDQDTVLFKGSRYQFKVRATDTNVNPLNLANRAVRWSTDMGTIADDGSFTANGQVGTGTVTATIDGVSGSAKVQVVDGVDDFTFVDADPLILQPGNTKVLKVNAQVAGRDVVLDGNSIVWSVPAELGTISSDGTFKVNANVPAGTKGVIVARVGNLEKSFNLLIGLKEVVLDNFEHNDITRYQAAPSNSTVKSWQMAISNEQAHSGQYSLKLDYNYTGWTANNGTMNINPLTTLSTSVMPKKFGTWLYGDGQAPWLRAILVDGTGSSKTLDMVLKVDWKGWKYVSADIDPTWKLPLRVSRVYMVEIDKSLVGKNVGGTVYFDDFRFAFTDDEDLSGPAFAGTFPAGNKVYSDSFTFTTTVSDTQSGVDFSSLTMNVDGQALQPEVDTATGKVSYAFNRLAEGAHHLVLNAKDKAGNPAVPAIDKTFTVDLSPDETRPAISHLTPTTTAVEKSTTPRVTFQLTDEQSGIDASSVKVSLDQVPAELYFDQSTGWGYALPTKPLADGAHRFLISASDKAGNALDTVQRTFTVQSLTQPRDPDNFAVSVLPDTQGFTYTEQFFKRAASENSELVMHVGDMVEQSLPDEWAQNKEYLKLFGNKPYVTVAGNHEAFQGNLDFYTEQLGSPTYHMNFGHTLVVGLNTALDQSLTTSDPTQFVYLQRVLDENRQKNIIVTTHVITRDDYGTKHEMAPADAAKFEGILSAYKKTHPDVNITVLFGHLHTLQSWEKDGVKYIITGNAANKAYVTTDFGSFLGSGLLSVSRQGMTYKYKPLLTAISVVDDALDTSRTLQLARGSQRQLNLYGDFREVVSNYIVNLSSFPEVDITWRSSDPRIATVNSEGEITAVRPGQVQITASSGDKTTAITLKVVDPSMIQPVKLTARVSDERILTGEGFSINVTAIDRNDVAYALNSRAVSWTSSNERVVHIERNGRFRGLKPGVATLTYSYQGLKGTLQVEVHSRRWF